VSEIASTLRTKKKLGDIRLILAEQLGRRASARLILIIDVAELCPALSITTKAAPMSSTFFDSEREMGHDARYVFPANSNGRKTDG
jgi:hypothetical protein